MEGERNMDRALGALAGVALGDAMGMPTQTMSREQITEAYGVVDDLVDAVPEQPVSAGLKAGTVTDDMEQSMLLAHHLIARNGKVDDEIWARTLLDWERDTHARGVNDLLGPSTKRAIDALLRGVPVSETGRAGTTNGAAMRIVPVAIATPPEPLSAFVDAVAASCRLTHNTAVAIGAAAAVASVVSQGIEGVRFNDAVPLALQAARRGETLGAAPSDHVIADRIEWALGLAEGNSGLHDAGMLAGQIGTSVAAHESIPMAFAIARLSGCDPWQCAILSANIGDDTDTIGAISTGMAGACIGFSAIPADKWARIAAVNGFDLAPIVRDLLAIRASRSGARPSMERPS